MLKVFRVPSEEHDLSDVSLDVELTNSFIQEQVPDLTPSGQLVLGVAVKKDHDSDLRRIIILVYRVVIIVCLYLFASKFEITQREPSLAKFDDLPLLQLRCAERKRFDKEESIANSSRADDELTFTIFTNGTEFERQIFVNLIHRLRQSTEDCFSILLEVMDFLLILHEPFPKRLFLRVFCE